jgi:hypothetical protein
MRSTASTRSVAQLFGAFALVALGTALVMATDLLLPNVTQSGLCSKTPSAWPSWPSSCMALGSP